MANETKDPALKQYHDFAKGQVDEQAILDRYNDLTQQQFVQQRDQNKQAEGQFYNQMYNNQLTAMDTIRQGNAQAVQTGASRGVQAANELAAVLGLQTETVGAATELANVNRQTAQEETAAMLQNILTANQEATRQRETLTQQGYEAESVAATERTAQAEAELRERELAQQQLTNVTAINETDPIAYANAVSEQVDLNTYSDNNYATLQAAINKIEESVGISKKDFDGWFKNGAVAKSKINDIVTNLETLGRLYGVDLSQYSSDLDKLRKTYTAGAFSSKAHNYGNFVNKYSSIKNKILQAYSDKDVAPQQ